MQSGPEALAAAVRSGDARIVRSVLKRFPELARRLDEPLPGDAFGTTPLLKAVSQGNREMAEVLLEYGADIDAVDVDHESTAAQWMVRDRQEVARYLVSRGCRTDILLASALGNADLVSTHLGRRPDAIRTVVSEEFFPKQDPRSGGTIYNWTLGTGKGAHVIAREFGHDHVFRLLMERSPLELQLVVWCEQADSDEVAAVLTRDPAVVRRLSAADHRKLPDAARDENAAAVRLMLSAGWPTDARGQHEATALHWAAFHGNVEIVRDILQHGPPLEPRDADFDATPLFWCLYGSVHGWRAGTGNYPAVAEALLEAGALPPPVSDDLPASDAVRAVLLRHVR